MRITKILLHDINFIEKEYDPLLEESIKRIGLSFPIKVEFTENGYRCIDGHKRLTVLKKLDIIDVSVIVMNNGHNRSNDCWRDRNYH